MKVLFASLAFVALLSPAATAQSFSNETLVKDVAELKRQVAALEQRLDLVISMLNRQSGGGAATGGMANQSAPGTTAPSPPPARSSAASTPSTPPVSTTRTQCRATTKKGTQCSRMAAAGASYCWQHGK